MNDNPRSKDTVDHRDLAPPADRSRLPVTVAEINAFVDRLGDGAPAISGSDVIDRIAALEKVKRAATAAQARAVIGLLTSQSGRDLAREIGVEQTIRSVGGEVGLARRESPHRGARFVRLARILNMDMPHTMAALTTGEISEYRASIIAAGTSYLTPTDRARLDAGLAGTPGPLAAYPTVKLKRRPRGSGTDWIRPPPSRTPAPPKPPAESPCAPHQTP